jgi:DNA-binding transcriptional ArsR family regulator
MRKHNGMRPQDVVILLKMVGLGERPWRYSDLAQALHISQSEVAEALNRCRQARLVDASKKKVFRLSLLEFLQYGLKYVFPAQPGALVRGIPTAHSAKPLSEIIVADTEAYVWPSAAGSMRGQAVTPLYPSVIKAIREDQALYEMLALVDALRVGRAREQKLAIEALTEIVNAPQYAQQNP